MASITISRGTPFSAASWVMAVTNSLFMKAFPPLLFVSMPPTTKEVGATHFDERRDQRRRVQPCQTQVYQASGLASSLTIRRNATLDRISSQNQRGGGLAHDRASESPNFP